MRRDQELFRGNMDRTRQWVGCKVLGDGGVIEDDTRVRLVR